MDEIRELPTHLLYMSNKVFPSHYSGLMSYLLDRLCQTPRNVLCLWFLKQIQITMISDRGLLKLQTKKPLKLNYNPQC